MTTTNSQPIITIIPSSGVTKVCFGFSARLWRLITTTRTEGLRGAKILLLISAFTVEQANKSTNVLMCSEVLVCLMACFCVLFSTAVMLAETSVISNNDIVI